MVLPIVIATSQVGCSVEQRLSRKQIPPSDSADARSIPKLPMAQSTDLPDRLVCQITDEPYLKKSVKTFGNWDGECARLFEDASRIVVSPMRQTVAIVKQSPSGSELSILRRSRRGAWLPGFTESYKKEISDVYLRSDSILEISIWEGNQTSLATMDIRRTSPIELYRKTIPVGAMSSDLSAESWLENSARRTYTFLTGSNESATSEKSFIPFLYSSGVIDTAGVVPISDSIELNAADFVRRADGTVRWCVTTTKGLVTVDVSTNGQVVEVARQPLVSTYVQRLRLSSDGKRIYLSVVDMDLVHRMREHNRLPTDVDVAVNADLYLSEVGSNEWRSIGIRAVTFVVL